MRFTGCREVNSTKKQSFRLGTEQSGFFWFAFYPTTLTAFRTKALYLAFVINSHRYRTFSQIFEFITFINFWYGSVLLISVYNANNMRAVYLVTWVTYLAHNKRSNTF